MVLFLFSYICTKFRKNFCAVYQLCARTQSAIIQNIKDVLEHKTQKTNQKRIRKGETIIVDTYGGYSRHGGGAFSGKDPTKVDRSAAYAARYIAKNVVAAGLADKCEVQLAYAIGVAKPVSILIDTFGTGKVDEEKLSAAVDKVFDLRPAAIIKMLDLRKPQYRKLAAYGHMGREDLGVVWEKTDKVDAIKEALAEL